MSLVDQILSNYQNQRSKNVPPVIVMMMPPPQMTSGQNGFQNPMINPYNQIEALKQIPFFQKNGSKWNQFYHDPNTGNWNGHMTHESSSTSHAGPAYGSQRGTIIQDHNLSSTSHNNQRKLHVCNYTKLNYIQYEIY